jgi:hypothetical protein
MKFLLGATAVAVTAVGGGAVVLKQQDLGNLIGVQSGDTLLSAPFQMRVAFDNPGNNDAYEHHEEQTGTCDFSVSLDVTCSLQSAVNKTRYNPAYVVVELSANNSDILMLKIVGNKLKAYGGLRPVPNQSELGPTGNLEPVVAQYADATEADDTSVSRAYSVTTVPIPSEALDWTFTLPMQSFRLPGDYPAEPAVDGAVTVQFLPMSPGS